MQEQIETKEKEKKQWQNFSSKAFGKKGFVKKSIFKTPESSDGKVKLYIVFQTIYHKNLSENHKTNASFVRPGLWPLRANK